MPKKYIPLVPWEMRFKERDGKEIEGDDGLMSWKKFLEKVEDNPKWVTTYKLGVSMDAVWDAYQEALTADTDNGVRIMVLAEEDWKNLEECCQNPKVMVIGPAGPQNMPGWGIHPRLNRQMLCFPKAVIKALDEDPRKKKPEDAESEDEAVEKEEAAA
jgi:hypothetical protein